MVKPYSRTGTEHMFASSSRGSAEEDGASRLGRGLRTVEAGATITLRTTDMPAGSAIRNRSEPVTVVTPRGGVEVVRQEMRGLRRGTSRTWFWLARRKGSSGWSEASTAREAIRRAMCCRPASSPLG
jgi:hypothetical protein